jgi:hypothetical protein
MGGFDPWKKHVAVGAPKGAAIQRALHQTLDTDPKILDDPIGVRLVDPSNDFYRDA